MEANTEELAWPVRGTTFERRIKADRRVMGEKKASKVQYVKKAPSRGFGSALASYLSPIQLREIFYDSVYQ